MMARKFEQEWTEQRSALNGMVECNVLVDFFEYLKNMRHDLNAIKKHHEKQFNEISSKPISHYIDIMEERIVQFYDICVKPEHRYHLGFIDNYDVFKNGVLTIDGNKFKINDKYYRVLNKLAESVFQIEEIVSKPVEMLWQKALTDSNEYDENGEYFMLAHVDYKTEKSGGISNYNQNQQGLCFSVVSDSKTRLYDNSLPYYSYYNHPRGAVGIIAKPKQGAILGASYDDMLSTEYINGKCDLIKHFNHSLVNRCYQNGNSEICCRGTKIFPPKEIFGLSVDTINEVILDSKKIDVVSVFYVKDRNGNKPARFEEYKKEQEAKWGKKLNVIELSPRNKTGQINLAEVYDCQ